MQALTEKEETVGGYLTSWLQHSKTRVRAKTHEGYEGLVRLYARPGIGDIPLGSHAALRDGPRREAQAAGGRS